MIKHELHGYRPVMLRSGFELEVTNNESPHEQTQLYWSWNNFVWILSIDGLEFPSCLRYVDLWLIQSKLYCASYNFATSFKTALNKIKFSPVLDQSG